MKSDSLIKVTASLLSLSLLASTCFTTVTQAAGSKTGIISENPVSLSSHMIQNMSSATVDMVMSTSVNDVASKTKKNTKTAELNKGKTEQKKTTEVRSAKGATADMAGNVVNANEKIEGNTDTTANPEVEKKVESKYANKGIAVEDVVNIRKEANTTSEIKGRLYKGSMCTILNDKDGWVQIESGDVKGYIKKDLLAIGEAAEKIAAKYMTKYATVNTVTLKVREKNTTESSVLVLVGQDETYKILDEGKVWCKVKIDNETVGYVLKEYVVVKEKFAKAISMDEIRAQEEEEEARQEETRTENTRRTNTRRTNNSTRRSTSKKSSSSSSSKTYSNPGSKTGSSVASYALQFKGNPYRYGGTSLTNGADCSGFVQSVYAKFGYSLARTSSAQSRSAGTPVSVNSLQPGDLLFYGSSGSVGHVGIYIGGGQIVHASNARDGIKVSNYKYRTPIKARRVIN